MLNLDAGKYHGLNAVATSMVAALEESATVGDAARAVAQEYDQPLERIVEDMTALIADLVDRGLATVEYSERRGLEAERVGDGLVGDGAVEGVDAEGERGVGRQAPARPCRPSSSR